jgi:hypothetical protein
MKDTVLQKKTFVAIFGGLMNRAYFAATEMI